MSINVSSNLVPVVAGTWIDPSIVHEDWTIPWDRAQARICLQWGEISPRGRGWWLEVTSADGSVGRRSIPESEALCYLARAGHPYPVWMEADWFARFQKWAITA